MSVYILYHANCLDGKAAAWAAVMKYGSNAVYVPVEHAKPPPEDVLELGEEDEVYIVDFAYEPKYIAQMREGGAQVTIIDHHVTNRAMLEGVEGCIFDMTKSGCVLAYEYFHPDKPVPKLLRHIQDGDIWPDEPMPDSKAICFALSPAITFEELYGLVQGGQASLDMLREKGETRIHIFQELIDAHLKNFRIMEIFGHRVAFGECNTKAIGSQLGHQACLMEDDQGRVDFSCFFKITPEGVVELSFRSIKPFDVSVVATALGGGGHPQACGARISLDALGDIYRLNAPDTEPDPA